MRTRIWAQISGSRYGMEERRIFRNFMWLSAPLPILFVTGIAQAAMTARILGPEGFGVLAIYFAVRSGIFGVFSSPASELITTYVSKHSVAGELEEAAKVTRFAAMFSILASTTGFTVLTLFTIFGSHYVGLEEAHRTLLIVFGLTGLITAFQSESTAILRLADRTKYSSLATIAGALIRLTIVAIALASGWKLGSVVAAHVVGAAVTAVIITSTAVYFSRSAGIEGILKSPTISVPREVKTFQLLSFGKSTVKALRLNIDILLLSNMLSIGQLGLFRAAKQISDFSNQPFSAITTSVQTEYSRLWFQGDSAGLKKIVARVATLVFTLSAIGSIVLIMFRKPIIELVLGPEFSESSDLLLILVPAAFLLSSMSSLTSLPAALGHSAPTFWAGIVGVMSLVAIILVTVPTHGMNGAAWAIFAQSSLVVLVTLFYLVKIVRSNQSRS